MERPLSPPRPLQQTTKTYKNLDDLLPPLDSLVLESQDDRDKTEDIFKEFYSFLRPKADSKGKYSPKTEEKRPVYKFTDEFKKTIQDIRKETGVNDSLLDEEAAIIEILEKQPTVALPNAKFNDTRGTPIEIEGETDDASVSSTSTESNFWRLLLANSSSKFQVSPPVFDAFQQEEKHWLERPPVPWEKLEASRKKCKKWLAGKKIVTHKT